MGFAAILIILCHAIGGAVPIDVSPFWRHILSYGNFGVDVFLFLSGIGMYYSLSKDTPKGYFSWLLHRYLRIGIPYLIIAVPGYIIKTALEGRGLIGFFYD